MGHHGTDAVAAGFCRWRGLSCFGAIAAGRALALARDHRASSPGYRYRFATTAAFDPDCFSALASAG